MRTLTCLSWSPAIWTVTGPCFWTSPWLPRRTLPVQGCHSALDCVTVNVSPLGPLSLVGCVMHSACGSLRSPMGCGSDPAAHSPCGFGYGFCETCSGSFPWTLIGFDACCGSAPLTWTGCVSCFYCCPWTLTGCGACSGFAPWTLSGCGVGFDYGPWTLSDCDALTHYDLGILSGCGPSILTDSF